MNEGLGELRVSQTLFYTDILPRILIVDHVDESAEVRLLYEKEEVDSC